MRVYLLIGMLMMQHGWAQQDPLPAKGEGGFTPQQARALIEEWVKTERLITEEKRDWQVEQQALNNLLELYLTEITLLEEELATAGDSLSSADAEKQDLDAKVAQARQTRKALTAKTNQQRERLLSIAQFFPSPLKQQLSKEMNVLKEATTAKLLREQALSMLNAVKAAGQFNRIVSLSNETQVDSSGQKRQLRVLYLGLGQAYYLSGSSAGVGKPAEGGWKWVEDVTLRPAIEQAIAIVEKTSQPRLVELPVEVQR